MVSATTLASSLGGFEKSPAPFQMAAPVAETACKIVVECSSGEVS